MTDSFDGDVRQFWDLGFRIVLDGEKRLASYLSAHDLTPPQFYVLKTLTEHDGRCTIGDIARAHHLTPATLSGLINRMAEPPHSLVMREVGATDRRSVDVVLTEAGRERFQAVQSDMMAQVRLLLRLMSADEREYLLRLLTRYALFTQAVPP